MINKSLLKNNIKGISLLYIITTSIWFLRMVVPGMKYVFLFSFIILSASFLLSLNKDLIKKVIFYEFIKTFNPLLILFLLYILGLIISKEIAHINFKDLFEFTINLSLMFYLFILTYKHKNYEFLSFIFNKIILFIRVTSVVVAVLGLIKYIFYSDFNLIFQTPFGTAFNTDNNFYALFSFLGIVSFYSLIISKQNKLNRFFIQLSISILIANILFSYSVRAFILLGVIFFFLISIQFIWLFKKNNSSLINLFKNTRFLTIIIFMSAIILINLNKSVKKEFLAHYISNIQKKPSADNIKNKTIYKAFNLPQWNYALKLFRQQRANEKIFGSGFHYLKAFGNEFYNNSGRIYYPHNPILSALLYSGIIGAVFVLVFLIISFYYGVIYFRKYTTFSLMLFTSLFFVFFSGNSIFSIPIFLFLFSFSFLIRYKEITELKIPNINKPGSRFIKESFDYILSVIIFIILFPVLFIVALAILTTMGWPVLYTQHRIGQNGKKFRLYKFRTMNKLKSKVSVSASELERISKFGRFLRKSKIDELPELLNIIRGDMSFVGTRPDVPGYADKLTGEDRIILDLKPGLTGPASLKYVNEEDLLSKVENPIKYNDEVIFPDKVRINKDYMKNWSFWLDIKIIIYTVLRKQLKDDFLV